METLKEAQDSLPDGHVVAGTIGKDGHPVYFHVPADADADVMRAEAFRAREGREMTEYELAVLREAEERHLEPGDG